MPGRLPWMHMIRNTSLLPGGHIIGVITATRITVHTPVTSVF